jgi:TatA/E family protein of Tat protein translocase
MPFNIQWPEIVLILVIVLIIFGAGKLPQIGNAIGKSIKEFRKARSEEEEDKSKAKTATTSGETESKEKS